MKLNLGCGRDIKVGYLNCDISKRFGADKVLDLNVFPYPFKDESVEEIYMNHILEHLDHPTKVLNECHRILKRRGMLFVNVPYDNEYGDIHKQNFLLTFFTFFAKEGIPKNYRKERLRHERGNWEDDENYKKFSRMSMELVLPRGIFLYNYAMGPFINWLTRISPAYYEQTPLKSFFPANEIKVVYIK